MRSVHNIQIHHYAVNLIKTGAYAPEGTGIKCKTFIPSGSRKFSEHNFPRVKSYRGGCATSVSCDSSAFEAEPKSASANGTGLGVMLTSDTILCVLWGFLKQIFLTIYGFHWYYMLQTNDANFITLTFMNTWDCSTVCLRLESKVLSNEHVCSSK